MEALRLQTHDFFSLGSALEQLMLLNPGGLGSHRKRPHTGYGSKPTECRQGDEDLRFYMVPQSHQLHFPQQPLKTQTLRIANT